MPRFLAALASGLLFGLGLTVSGMINPAKVLGFLDLAGAWDPSLAFVMAAAIPVAAAGFAVARHRPAPLCAPAFSGPARTGVDSRLVIGAMLFGIGWGLVGYCPGPAVASLAFGGWQAAVFVAAMLAGMGAFRVLDRATTPRPRAA
ncbi:DUF6691 family protein [Limobrevibacterium gyesilva]|uniref:YeeE/YedE family protein n=1 Tax=Limobrevibacterium gyesilva TaxID=2991712 RepID=A0AA41YJ99_9PROT|nr:DUF6691 family protein [Limobrevibacterium gyesilva]MCW3474204.1 YeeE/YedE family protein [Limobrevibacterium gyesilva]